MVDRGVGIGMRQLQVAAPVAGFAIALLTLAQPKPVSAGIQGVPETGIPEQALVNRYCLGCHNDQALRGGLSLEDASLAKIAGHEALWERVLRKLRAGAMPPNNSPRPDSTG